MTVRCPRCGASVEIDLGASEYQCTACHHQISVSIEDTIDFAVPRGPAEASDFGTPPRLVRFQLLQELGRGAHGTVWLAHDKQHDRRVAIKLVSGVDEQAASAERLKQEARLVARLRHPNIVRLYEVGSESGQLYIFTEYIGGPTLREWMGARRPSVESAVALCVRLADALDHAHRHEVVHRDLQPGNIIVDEDDEPHIADFGLAADFGEMVEGGPLLGTPAYMSPEQASGQRVDWRADIHALGVILYELLTGRRPYVGEARDILEQIIRQSLRVHHPVNSQGGNDRRRGRNHGGSR